ncbi:MAG: hypothetical protein ABR573_03160, partial [Candidatus Dormibacteria bacterium]
GYRNWTDAIFLLALALGSISVAVSSGSFRRDQNVTPIMATEAVFGLVAGFYYGVWRTAAPGSLESSQSRVRSSNFLAVFCLFALVICTRAIIG